MNETGRGVLIFVSVLITIWLWAPLSNRATRAADGVITSETYFGPLHYLTLHTELKEPNYNVRRHWDGGRLAVTAVVTVALWGAVIWKVRGKSLVPPDPADESVNEG